MRTTRAGWDLDRARQSLGVGLGGKSNAKSNAMENALESEALRWIAAKPDPKRLLSALSTRITATSEADGERGGGDPGAC